MFSVFLYMLLVISGIKLLPDFKNSLKKFSATSTANVGPEFELITAKYDNFQYYMGTVDTIYNPAVFLALLVCSFMVCLEVFTLLQLPDSKAQLELIHVTHFIQLTLTNSVYFVIAICSTCWANEKMKAVPGEIYKKLRAPGCSEIAIGVSTSNILPNYLRGKFCRFTNWQRKQKKPCHI